MRRTVLKFGLASGVLAGAMMGALVTVVKTGAIDFEQGVTWGYATMIVALSLVFFGTKSYRDRNGGRITFLKGLQVGLLISLVSAFGYAVSWEVYYPIGGQEFMQKYTAYYLDEMKAGGASHADIEKARAESEQFMARYRNVFVRFALSLMEIAPVGVIVSLGSAALLRKRDLLPAGPASK